MTFHRSTLFKLLQQKFGKLDDVQATVVAAIVSEFERRKLADVRWLAYILVTAWHEARFKPLREGDSKGQGITDAQAQARVAAYCKKMGKKNYAALHPKTKQSYYGRGLVQLTHFANYLKFEETLGLPLTTQPDTVLTVPVGVAIMFEGMTTGVTAKDSFTKYQLQDFFNATRDDPVQARRIINRMDDAQEIAKLHVKMLDVLQHAKLEKPVPDITPAAMKPKPVETRPSAAEIAAGAAVAVGTGAGAAASFSVPWASIGLALGCIAFASVIAVLIFKLRKGSK